MATKAQLMAELELLKQQMASRDDMARSQTNAGDETANNMDNTQDSDPNSHLANLLESHGIDKNEIDALWTQLTEELGDLAREKPLLTATAAFAAGIALGRMSK